jgi:SAM-dependent methyltransferase
MRQLEAAFAESAFIKLTLSKPTGEAGDLKNLYARPALISGKLLLSFIFRYATRDETKNFDWPQASALLRQHLGAIFLNADFAGTREELSLQFSRKRIPRLHTRPAQNAPPPLLEHDTPKKRLIETKGNAWLHAMGIINAQGEVLAAGQRKFRQIDKYIEIVDSLIRQQPLPPQPRIVDMGAGKGYLTFALYDHLKNNLGLEPHITGLEIRPHLVEFANALAAEAGFTGLHFEAQDLREYRSDALDMLIALHACDTLTDAAIAEGIRSSAGIILVAPCCHKQIRKQLNPAGPLKDMLKHGILQERQAELLTDSIRALLMEAEGYQTKVFEFVSIEHTNKNLMISGTRAQPNPVSREKAAALKQAFGIEYHYLEKLLETL